MPVDVTQIAQQPIIVATVIEPFAPLKEMPDAEQQFQELAATIQGIIYRIIDVTQWRITFSDLMLVLDIDTRGGSGVDPRVRTVIVGSGEMVTLGIEAMKQQQYGAVNIPGFATMAEALAFVEAQLAAR
jgi:hypothetical protein